MGKHYVYVVKEVGTSFCKVGVSEDVRERVKQLQAGNPRDFLFLLSKEFQLKENALHAEAAIIRFCSRWSLGREWFELYNSENIYAIESQLDKRIEHEEKMLNGDK